MLRGRLSLLLLGTAFGSLAFALLAVDPYNLSLLIWIVLNAVLATSLRFVLLVGETNLATAAFFGVGAYSAGVATANFGLPFPVAMLASGVVAAALSAVFGFVTLRVLGPYFMLISFAFTEVTRLIYTRVDYLGGNSGIVGLYPPTWADAWMPALAVTLGFALIIGSDIIERSSLGRVFAGIRANPGLMATLGFNVHRNKVLCVVLASFAAGVAGGLQAFTAHVISPDDFGYVVAVFALAYLKIGGESHVLGAVLGAALLTLASQWLHGSGAADQIMYGSVIVAAVLLFPGGLLRAGIDVGRVLRAVSSRSRPAKRTAEKTVH